MRKYIPLGEKAWPLRDLTVFSLQSAAENEAAFGAEMSFPIKKEFGKSETHRARHSSH
jgi:hypothetical protein